MATAFVSQQAPGTGTIVTGVAHRIIVVDSVVLSCGGATGTAQLVSSTGPTAVTPVFNLPINGNLTFNCGPNAGGPGVATASGDSLQLVTVGGSSTVSCLVNYHMIQGA